VLNTTPISTNVHLPSESVAALFVASSVLEPPGVPL